MKSLLYLLAVVALVTAGLAVKASLPGMGDPGRKCVTDVAPSVDVNIDMRAGICRAAVRSAFAVTSRGLGSVRFAQPDRGMTLPALRLGAAPALVTRHELMAEAAGNAENALSGLEAEQMHALESRLIASRAAMMQSAESEINVRKREIEDSVIRESMNVTEQYSGDRLNAQLKVFALEGQIKSVGVDVHAVESKLKAAQDELDRISRISSTHDKEVTAEAERQIAALRSSAAAKIDAAIGAQEKDEARRISKDASAARADVLSEMRFYDSARGTLASDAYSRAALSGTSAADQRNAARNRRKEESGARIPPTIRS